MLKYNLYIFSVLYAFVFSFANAEDIPHVPMPRITIEGKGVRLAPGKGSEGTSVGNFTWGEEDKRKFWLWAQCNVAKPNEWTTFTFSFTPEEDGKVLLNLHGVAHKSPNKQKNNQLWVYYTSVSATGANIRNGNFEKVNNGAPVSWWFPQKKYIDGGEGVFANKKAVLVCHDQPCIQQLEVKCGQEVTLTVVAMPGNFEASLE